MNNHFKKQMFDKTFRAQLINKSRQSLAELLGDAYDPNVEYKICCSDANTTYIVMPDNNQNSDYDLEQINAAGSTSTASSAGSFGSAGTVCTTFSTAGTSASLGSIGSVG